MSHQQVVGLASWQEDGLKYIASLPPDQRKPVLMDEFNSASCGGVPESNMFGVGLWSADYALQLAAVGYFGAYLHTREHNVTYNVWNPPAGPAGGPGNWTTNTNFYAMLAVTEALQGPNGNKVVDLNLQHTVPTTAGYAIYDGASPSTVRSIVLINYANSTQATDFALPASFFNSSAGSDAVLVRYMYAPSATETTDVNWGNITYAGVGDGVAVASQSAWTEKTVSCTGGCTVSVPGPALAVVFAAGVPDTTGAANSTTNGTTAGSGTSSGASPANTSGGNNNAASKNAALVGAGAPAMTALLALVAFSAMLF